MSDEDDRHGSVAAAGPVRREHAGADLRTTNADTQRVQGSALVAGAQRDSGREALGLLVRADRRRDRLQRR